jgi:uncharacterized protein DUF6538
MDVARHPGLMRRGARYYLRVRVPLDLIESIGRQEIWQSLRTADHREAVHRYFPARTELQQRFENARRRRAGLSNDEARRLASDWLQAEDRRAASLDFGLLSRDRRDALAETEQRLFDLIEGADGESVQAALDPVLISAGWPARQYVVGSIRTRRLVADVDPAETAELHHLIRRGLIELARRRLERLNGRPSTGLDPVFLQPVSSADGPGGLTLDELAQRFLAERAPAMLSKTLTEYEALARVLKEVWGEHLPVREITREHCRQIRDLFAALPSNWTKRFPRLTTMQAAEHAKAHGIAPMDPTTRQQAPRPDVRHAALGGAGGLHHPQSGSRAKGDQAADRCPRRSPAVFDRPAAAHCQRATGSHLRGPVLDPCHLHVHRPAHGRGLSAPHR